MKRLEKASSRARFFTISCLKPPARIRVSSTSIDTGGGWLPTPILSA